MELLLGQAAISSDDRSVIRGIEPALMIAPGSTVASVPETRVVARGVGAQVKQSLLVDAYVAVASSGTRWTPLSST